MDANKKINFNKTESNMESVIKTISIRGRMYFCISCVFNALHQENIKSDEIKIILDRLTEFLHTNKLDDWEDSAVEISPDTIFDTHSDNNFDDYNTLSRQEIENLKSFYLNIPQSITQMIDLAISVGLSNLYGATGEFSPYTLKPTLALIKIMEENRYKLPDINYYTQYPFSEKEGWGNFITVSQTATFQPGGY